MKPKKKLLSTDIIPQNSIWNTEHYSSFHAAFASVHVDVSLTCRKRRLA